MSIWDLDEHEKRKYQGRDALDALRAKAPAWDRGGRIAHAPIKGRPVIGTILCGDCGRQGILVDSPGYCAACFTRWRRFRWRVRSWLRWLTTRRWRPWYLRG